MQIVKHKSVRETRRKFFRVFKQNTKQKSAREARRIFLGYLGKIQSKNRRAKRAGFF